MVAFNRQKAERLAGALFEYRMRQAKAEQSQRGWYDENGVRQGGLIAFVRYFWHILEPQTPFIDGWPLWAICEHLESVTAGEVTRLLITVPPGFAKSILVDVFWPAWEWGPMKLAHYRYVAFSYSATLTERDNGRFRDLIASPLYQKMYGPLKTTVEGKTFGVEIRNKTTVKVINTSTGWKLASSVGGVGTGERGHRVVCDDLHNVKEAESETIRTETVRWFRESVSSRFNDLETGALVIVMQRVHELDVAGVILDLELDYCHLMIPWEYDSSRQVDDDGNPKQTAIGWTDPRYDENHPYDHDGEPAWPERFSVQSMARTKKEVGPFAFSGQFQQSPSPRGGGIFQRDWWECWDSPDGKFPALEYVVASLDPAATEKQQNDPSGFTVWGVFNNEKGNRRIILLHAWEKRLIFNGPTIEQGAKESAAAYRHRTMSTWGLVQWTVDTCRRFKVDRLLIEATSNGLPLGDELRRLHGREGWAIQLVTPKGDKVARALAVQATFSQGMIYAPIRDWSQTVIDQCATFPVGKHDDLVDSMTMAIKHLRDSGLANSDEEEQFEVNEGLRLKSKQSPLYPV